MTLNLDPAKAKRPTRQKILKTLEVERLVPPDAGPQSLQDRISALEEEIVRLVLETWDAWERKRTPKRVSRAKRVGR